MGNPEEWERGRQGGGPPEGGLEDTGIAVFRWQGVGATLIRFIVGLIVVIIISWVGKAVRIAAILVVVKGGGRYIILLDSPHPRLCNMCGSLMATAWCHRPHPDLPTSHWSTNPPLWYPCPHPPTNWSFHHRSLQIPQVPQNSIIVEFFHQSHHHIEGMKWQGWSRAETKGKQGDCTEKILFQRKGNFPPAACGNAESCGAAWILLWRGVRCMWGWGAMLQGWYGWGA